ncbi:MAG TPA: GNAT family N-acetyltransferase [Bryobacteraceae bacterium]|jgi:CelD/BcsL family acetyltransferase involved in cellulose biosynthesis
MQSPGELRGRTISATALSAAEIVAWDALCREVPQLSSPFLSPHYALAVAAVRPHVYVCVLTRAARPVGFLPFQFRTAVHRLLRSAERVGEEMTDYFGLIAQPGLKLDASWLLRLSGLQVLNFSHLDETQAEWGLSGEEPEAGYLMRLDEPEPYWQMLRRTHKEFVTNTERRARQVEKECGPLRFTADERNWREPLDNLLRYKARQYAATGRSDLFAVGWKRALVEKLAAMREETCAGMLSTLHAGETWLASHFGLRCGGVLHYWFPVYNPEFSRFGPGRLLIKALIDHSRQMNLRLIDHGGGEARYKQECSNSAHTYYRGVWQRAGVRSLLGRAAESARWRMERAAAESR